MIAVFSIQLRLTLKGFAFVTEFINQQFKYILMHNSDNQVENLQSGGNDAKPPVLRRFFYFDQNRRVYEMNGVKSSRPFHAGYFKEIDVISEDSKQYVCSFGTINKRSMMYSWGRMKYKVYTEQEMLDEVYVAENRHNIAEKVRSAPANVLREIEELLKKMA
ncbi:MAG: hypothetical protein EOO46_21720 [Flavobacterium sp.]|nr:MAG: hypothetical protein EOO46_21720 [Flavobacterium sp.]